MNCQACKQGKARAGTTAVTLEVDGGGVNFVDVPAFICGECGAAYFGEESVRWMLEQHQQATKGLEIAASLQPDNKTENQ